MPLRRTLLTISTMTTPISPSISAAAPSAAVVPRRAIPPLQSGDRLTRAEFERRYAATPEKFKAELIEQVVYVGPSSVPVSHAGPHAQIIGWLGLYKWHTDGVDGGDNATIRLDTDNMPQPDALLRIRSEFGGQSKISSDDFIEGAPELVAEIAASSSSYDLHQKLNVYRRNGVREYVVWRTWDAAIDWFALREGEYVRRQPDERGCIKSDVFPGLWLDVPAMLRGDGPQVMRVLQEGLATGEHQKFVDQLAKRKEKP
jgi:Uma2 family endonuclease